MIASAGSVMLAKFSPLEGRKGAYPQLRGRKRLAPKNATHLPAQLLLAQNASLILSSSLPKFQRMSLAQSISLEAAKQIESLHFFFASPGWLCVFAPCPRRPLRRRAGLAIDLGCYQEARPPHSGPVGGEGPGAGGG
jgi:hypothetical protein